jgi:hypothetical protein
MLQLIAENWIVAVGGSIYFGQGVRRINCKKNRANVKKRVAQRSKQIGTTNASSVCDTNQRYTLHS